MSAPTPARRAAYETVRRVFEDGAWADRALRSAVARHGLDRRDRNFAQALAYGAVQRRGTTDAFVAGLTDRPVERIDPPLLAALRLGLFELLLMDSGDDHATVDQAVSLAKGRGGHRHGAGLVNAVLRRASRERKELLGGLDDSTPVTAAVKHSVPVWLAAMWWEELGPDVARSQLAAINRPPQRALRNNGLKVDRDGAMAELRGLGVDVVRPDPSVPPAPGESIVVAGGDRDGVETAIAAGTVVPQSRASAHIAEVLAPEPGERILDMCAGPGIKSGQIASHLGDGGSGLVAVERDSGRAGELAEMFERIGADRVVVENGDATDPRPAGEPPFDAVLVDPPCSGLGTLASRPDARWRRSPEDLERTAKLAAVLLARALEAVGADGRVVYSTCTVSRRENEEVVGAAPAGIDDIAVGADAPLASEIDGRCLQTRNDRDGTDGFFVARLRR